MWTCIIQPSVRSCRLFENICPLPVLQNQAPRTRHFAKPCRHLLVALSNLHRPVVARATQKALIKARQNEVNSIYKESLCAKTSLLVSSALYERCAESFPCVPHNSPKG